MNNLLKNNSLRDCRDFINGRHGLLAGDDHIVADYAAFRHYLKQQYPPMRGERLRRTVLLTIAILTVVLSCYIMFAPLL